jgi:hypothetical protein
VLSGNAIDIRIRTRNGPNGTWATVATSSKASYSHIFDVERANCGQGSKQRRLGLRIAE